MMLKYFSFCLLKAFVVCYFLYEISHVFNSFHSFTSSFHDIKTLQYDPSSTPMSIRMITSAQLQQEVGESPQLEVSIDYSKRKSSISVLPWKVLLKRIRDILRNITNFIPNMVKKLMTPALEDIPSNTQTDDLKFVYPKSWGDINVTEKEKSSLLFLHNKCSNENRADTQWLRTATPTDLLRFLRNKNGNTEEAYKSLIAHAKWRISKYGADIIVVENSFKDSALNKEVFWLGVSLSGCPTLVIRTQAHDGADYNEDPKIFTSFMVYMLEIGIKQYGLGQETQVCVILDRSTYLKRGVKKKEDMSAIPNLVKLFQHLYQTITDNYPDLLLRAQIVPASWFFSMCYRVTSRVMDTKSRAKFQTIKVEQIETEFAAMFPKEILPPHLGGTSDTYGGHPLNNKPLEGLELEKKETKIEIIDVEVQQEESVGTGEKIEIEEVKKVEKRIKKAGKVEKKLMKRDQERGAAKGGNMKNEIQDIKIGSVDSQEAEVQSDSNFDNGNNIPHTFVIVGDIDVAVVIDEPMPIGEDRMNHTHTGGPRVSGGGGGVNGVKEVSNLSQFNVAEIYADAGI